MARGRFFFLGQFQAAVGQTAHQQFQLRGIQLLALLAEEAPGQRVELLAQESIFPLQ
jgi:hypothetical protein